MYKRQELAFVAVKIAAIKNKLNDICLMGCNLGAGEMCIRDRYNVVANTMTALNIDYNDKYMSQFTHESGSKGILVVDVVSPVAVRKLEVYKENSYLSWNGTPDSLMAVSYTHLDVYKRKYMYRTILCHILWILQARLLKKCSESAVGLM